MDATLQQILQALYDTTAAAQQAAKENAALKARIADLERVLSGAPPDADRSAVPQAAGG